MVVTCTRSFHWRGVGEDASLVLVLRSGNELGWLLLHWVTMLESALVCSPVLLREGAETVSMMVSVVVSIPVLRLPPLLAALAASGSPIIL